MAELMADVHMGEAVVDLNRSLFPNDSSKQLMKQSIYQKHGVTSEQVDSSFMWYGQNITYYMEVYDKTIEILEHRLIETGNRIAANASLSIAGDSVDVWPNARFISFNDRLPSRSVMFNFSRDRNWDRGDNYTWRAKFFNHEDGSRWLVGVEYADGTIEYQEQGITGSGWKEIRLVTDSLLEPVRIFGMLHGANRPGTEMRLDSIEMVRKRVDRNIYNLRFAYRKASQFYPETEVENFEDSSANSDTIPTQE